MGSLTVSLSERAYEIEICRGFDSFRTMLDLVTTNNQVMIVTNNVIAPIYLDVMKEKLSGLNVNTCILEDGEVFKTLSAIEQVITSLLEARFDRGCTLIALGGGVVGDIAGFAASSYQRGVKFVQVPTTLLAQVDSSVGGKTGVNHPLGKNMIGAFYQPKLVYANVETLSTLATRELRAGIAEIIKYGLIARPDFFNWLEEHLDKLLDGDADYLAKAIKISCETKAEVVAKDERESGIRAILNLGHTFGHAIETGLGYGEWLHGEAVACGMCLAAKMSYLAGWIPEEALAKTVALIQRANLPTSLPPTLSATEMLNHMQVDKKNRDGKIRLVLLRHLGEAVISDDYDPKLLLEVLENPAA